MSNKRLSQETLQAFAKLDTSTISDALDKQGFCGGLHGIHAVVPGSKMCGQAFTVKYLPCGIQKGTVGDFLDHVPEGEIVVIDNAGRTTMTVFGDIMSIYAKQKKIGGTLIDGVCRDVKLVREIGYPIFSKGYFMVTGKDRVEIESMNQPVQISGLQVCPGDLIVADENGAVCIPLSMVERTLEVAHHIEETEGRIMAAIKDGMTLKEARAKMGYHHLQTKE